MPDFALIPKIVPALRRLRGHYDRKGESELRDIIDGCRVHIEPGTEYDNWNGGTYGHDVFLFVPDELMSIIDLDQQEIVHARFKEDMNKATPDIENEYVRCVFVAPIDETDPQFQASVHFTREPRANPNEVGLWQANCLRLFISHRDEHKAVAKALGAALEEFGVSAFVAHDAIKPMREWQIEIMRGLMTMEVMLVLLTDDFHDSVWTNQEVGFALGKGIPILTVKVGARDPQGFISVKQAMRADYKNIINATQEVHRLLVSEIGQEGRLKAIMIEALIRSNNYNETIQRLNRLAQTTERLSDTEFQRIVHGYRANDQLYGCYGIHNRGNWFKRYLEAATGKSLEFRGREIIERMEVVGFPI